MSPTETISRLSGVTGRVIRPNDPEYDRLWAVCQDLDIPVNGHGGVGSPQYPPFKSSTILHIQELTFYTRRPLVWRVS